MLYQRQGGMQKRLYMSPMNVAFWGWVPGIMLQWPLCSSETSESRRARRGSCRHELCCCTHACVLAVYISDSHCCHCGCCLLFMWSAGFGREALKNFSSTSIFRTWIWSVQNSSLEVWKSLKPTLSFCHAVWLCFIGSQPGCQSVCNIHLLQGLTA